MQPAKARAEVLAALEAVDLVVVFDEDTPEKLIARVKPTVLVKGGDYTREEVVGREIVEARGRRGGPDRDLVPGHSTTSMVERARAGEAAGGGLGNAKHCLIAWQIVNSTFLISVIITTYNREDALDAALRALAAQSDRNFEIVIADDGSGPDTARLVESWKPRLFLPAQTCPSRTPRLSRR